MFLRMCTHYTLSETIMQEAKRKSAPYDALQDVSTLVPYQLDPSTPSALSLCFQQHNQRPECRS